MMSSINPKAIIQLTTTTINANNTFNDMNSPQKHIHMYIYTHANAHTHAHTHMCTYIYIHTHTHTHVHTHTHTHIPLAAAWYGVQRVSSYSNSY